MIKLSWCDTCKHITGMIGFQPKCKAFPEGIPYDFDTSKDQEIKECNNGIKYEEKK